MTGLTPKKLSLPLAIVLLCAIPFLIARTAAVPVTGTPILEVHNGSLTTMLVGPTNVQDVAPLVQQRGVGIDGSLRAAPNSKLEPKAAKGGGQRRNNRRKSTPRKASSSAMGPTMMTTSSSGTCSAGFSTSRLVGAPSPQPGVSQMRSDHQPRRVPSTASMVSSTSIS